VGLIKYDVEDGNLRYTYNLFGGQRFTTESPQDLREGKHPVKEVCIARCKPLQNNLK
jgi:hypothetical protein